MRTVAIIPARMQAERLPGKPLADLAGVPLVVRVARQAQQARSLAAVYVASGDAEIVAAATAHGIASLLTRGDHASGSDRVVEALGQLLRGDAPPPDAVLNLQGDEPFIGPGDLDAMLARLAAEPWDMVTLARPLASQAEQADPNVVKVVCRDDGQALYFSRAPIPYPRRPGHRSGARRHLGVYAWRRAQLLALGQIPPHALELCEGLEQLRALAHGFRIGVITAQQDSRGIDTPEDLSWARAQLTQAGSVAFS